MSPEKNQEYFSDGLAEELLNALVKIPELRVTARRSSFQFKGKGEDLRVIGQKLNVATILEGSVRKEGNRVRINAQLVKVADGFQLWSETYDRELKDIFSVQEEIARSVAGALQVRLLGVKMPSARATSPEAYSAYLQGKYFAMRDTKEGMEKAISYFEQAIKLDPDYAPAWVGLGSTRATWEVQYTAVPAEEVWRKARESAERALALDPNLVEAHVSLGFVKHVIDWDLAGADAFYRRALELEPGNAGAVVAASSLAVDLGRCEEGLTLARRAAQLDPVSPGAYFMLGCAALWCGRLDEAAAATRKELELNPEAPGAHWLLGVALLLQSRPREALAEMERERIPAWRLAGLALAHHALGQKRESDAALAELVAKFQTHWVNRIAEVYAFRGEADRAFEWLERGYAQHAFALSDVMGGRGHPLLKNLERDPRYAPFVKKMRLRK